MISSRASPIRCNPKKIGVHNPFKISCKQNAPSAILTSLLLRPSFQIIKAEIPIITYRAGQTTPKVQSGGVKEGRDNSAYQVVTESLVAKEPRNPIKRQTATEHISLPILAVSCMRFSPLGAIERSIFYKIFPDHPPMINISHTTKVKMLTSSPFFAILQCLSMNIATKDTKRNTGGPNTITNPPRVRKMRTQPKPGIFSTVHINVGITKIHGNTANSKLIFPSVVDFILFLKT